MLSELGCSVIGWVGGAVFSTQYFLLLSSDWSLVSHFYILFKAVYGSEMYRL